MRYQTVAATCASATPRFDLQRSDRWPSLTATAAVQSVPSVARRSDRHTQLPATGAALAALGCPLRRQALLIHSVSHGRLNHRTPRRLALVSSVLLQPERTLRKLTHTLRHACMAVSWICPERPETSASQPRAPCRRARARHQGATLAQARLSAVEILLVCACAVFPCTGL